MHKYYINEDFRMRIFKIRGNEHPGFCYYAFYNYDKDIDPIKWAYVESSIGDILKECDKEKVDYLVYYYERYLYREYLLKEFSVFRALLEKGK